MVLIDCWLQAPCPIADVRIFTKTVSLTLTALRDVVARLPAIVDEALPRVLAALKIYMFYSLPNAVEPPFAVLPRAVSDLRKSPPRPDNQSIPTAFGDRPASPSALPQRASPSASCGYDPLGRLMAQTAMTVRSALAATAPLADAAAPSAAKPACPAPGWSSVTGTSDDSDTGDAGDAVAAGSRGRAAPGFTDSSTDSALPSRVRQAAMSCAQAVIRVASRRMLYSYWSSFIPDRPESPVPTLFTALAADPSPRARMACLAVLAALLDGSRAFLTAAVDAESRGAFTSHAAQTGAMIAELHAALMAAVLSEASAAPLALTIKCVALVASNCNYTRLRAGHVASLVRVILPRLAHRDTDVRVAALGCLASLFGTATFASEAGAALAMAWERDLVLALEGRRTTMPAADQPSAVPVGDAPGGLADHPSLAAVTIALVARTAELTLVRFLLHSGHPLLVFAFFFILFSSS